MFAIRQRGAHDLKVRRFFVLDVQCADNLAFNLIHRGSSDGGLRRSIWYNALMTKTLELAVSKAKKLPPAAQEAIGLELLDRIAALAELRREIQVGIDQLDSGLGREIDIETELRILHKEHGGKA